jgi:hypothetical protein
MAIRGLYMKESMRKIAPIAFTLLVLTCTGLGQAAASLQNVNISTLNWRVGSSDEPILKSIPKEQLARFVYQLIQQGEDENAKEHYSPVEKFLVGDYTFSDLDGDEHLELVASIDVAGRPFFNSVVVGRMGDRFVYDIVGSWGEVHNFSKEIQDLNGGGIMELLAREYWIYPRPEPRLEEAFDKYRVWALAGYGWVAIYHWRNGKLINVSTECPEYYREKFLPPLEESIAKIRQFKQASEADKRALASHFQVLMFKAQRLWGNKTVGLQEALTWADSDNPVLQDNAIRIFGEIGDAKSVNQLERLA